MGKLATGNVKGKIKSFIGVSHIHSQIWICYWCGSEFEMLYVAQEHLNSLGDVLKSHK